MGYSKETYAKAHSIMQDRRMNALREADLRKEQFYKKYPRAQQVERALSQTAAKAGNAVLSGANAKEELLKLKAANLSLQKELAAILTGAGVPDDYLEARFTCKTCCDKGYMDGKMCSCFLSLLKDVAYEELNALSPLSLCGFESFSLRYYTDAPQDGGTSPKRRMQQIFSFCKEYARSFQEDSESLLLVGATGLGKTHLALAIANEVINRGYGVVYCSVPDIARRLEQEHFSKGSEEPTQQSLTQCDLLILDDLGTEFTTPFTSSALYHIFNTRLMRTKPTIISTNLSLEEMERAYSERFVSRLAGSCQRLTFLGRDVRIQMKKESLSKR